ILREQFKIAVDVWSVTSFNELRKEGLSVERDNLMNPARKKKKVPYVTECLSGKEGPVVASTDYMKLYADQIREFVPGNYQVLGTDGFGRSDSREKLRHFFEVDRKFIVLAALAELNSEGVLEASVISKFMKEQGIDPEKVDPVTV
ncbi:MAG: pyruvate dehydrogenase (acetyl-transferring), homodimeric type, partial [Gammaproteobacteria bacterium]|nr:pyruvate dehydrogenase (acetyl-transferring), homodimeric type [Gammaproteobacteria bacterium]